MPDKPQLKDEALEFGRNLQRAFRTTMLYSLEHSETNKHLQLAFLALKPLLRQSSTFTLGFRGGRIVLNNIVTSERSLAQLESDFARRGVRGVTFIAGITFQQFKRGMSLISAKPSLIQQNGGIAAILLRNPLEGMEVLAAEIKEQREQKEDAVLETDAQSYLNGQAATESSGAGGLPGLNLLLRLGNTFQPAGYASTPGDALQLVWKATESALVRGQEGVSQHVVKALARALDELTPQYLLSSMPAQRQEELCGLSAEEIAAELAEDILLQWAANQLTNAAPGADGMNERREVALLVSRTARNAEITARLRCKLARLLESVKATQQILEQLDQELAWNSLSPQKKYAHLIALKLFSEADFFHLMSCIQESQTEAELGIARELALHYCRQYFASVQSAPSIIQEEWLARVPELLQAAVHLNCPEWMRAMAEGLCQLLVQEPCGRDYHSHTAVYLSGLAQLATVSEDYEITLMIGVALERSLARDPVQHAGCCQKAFANLLSRNSVERLIELTLQRTDDPALWKATFSLLKLAAAQVSDIALDLVDKEADIPKRLRVLRAAARLGPRAIEAVRKHLADEQWYMVRNAVSVLAGLGDPDLPQQLEPALRHPDPRVQQAAISALAKSNHPAKGQVLARALPFLPAHLQEMVLDALALLNDPAAVAPLKDFLLCGSGGRIGTMGKVIQVLAGTPGEQAVDALGEVLMLKSQAVALRKSALAVLLGRSSAQAKRLLGQLARNASVDPLAAELLSAESGKPA